MTNFPSGGILYNRIPYPNQVTDMNTMQLTALWSLLRSHQVLQALPAIAFMYNSMTFHHCKATPLWCPFPFLVKTSSNHLPVVHLHNFAILRMF